MKKLMWLIPLMVMTLLFSCASGTYIADEDQKSQYDGKRVIEVSNALTLSDLIERLPGVRMEYLGGRPEILIRGGVPLYVIDGTRVGHNYQAAANLVNVNDIASVEVLKSPTETLVYGRDAAFGVIVIRTRVS